jgi:peptide/nickel transport system substrate-binding protein
MRRRSKAVLVLTSVLAVLGASLGPVGAATPQGAAKKSKFDTQATVRFAYVGGVTNLDPHQVPNGTTNNYVNLFYDRLLILDQKARLRPGVAKSWEFSGDGLTLTMKLEDKATFADDTPIDAAAAKFSIERAKTLATSTAKVRLESIASIEARDRTTLVLRLSTPDRTILNELAAFPGSLVNPIARDGRDLTKSPNGAGSGPYDLVSFVPNESMVAERTARKHWDPKVARVKRFEIQRVATSDAMLAGVISNQLDVGLVTGMPLDLVEQQVASSDVRVHRIFSVQKNYFLMRNTMPPFTDLRVRQAIAMGVDWQSISPAYGDGCAPTAQEVVKGSPGYIEGKLPLAYNVNKAKNLLTQAGVSGLKFDLIVGQRDTWIRAAQAAQQQLKTNLGIDANIVVVPLLQAGLDFRDGKAPALIGAFAPEPSPEQLVRAYTLTNLKLAGPDAPVLEPLLKKALDPTLAAAKADAALQDLFGHLHEQAYMIPICFAQSAWIANKKIVQVDKIPWSFANGFDLRYLAVKKAGN